MDTTPRPPAELLRAAAARLRTLAEAASEDLKTNPYWRSELRPDAPYANGVRNGLGGAAGDLAAALTPEAATALADWLEAHARHLSGTTHPGWQECVSPQPVALARAILAGAGEANTAATATLDAEERDRIRVSGVLMHILPDLKWNGALRRRLTDAVIVAVQGVDKDTRTIRRCLNCKAPEHRRHKTSCDYVRYPSHYPDGPVYEDAPAQKGSPVQGSGYTPAQLQGADNTTEERP